MVTQLFKQPVFAIITVFGCFLILGGLFQIDDISKLAFSPLKQPLYISVTIGVLLTGTGIGLYILSNLSFTTFSVSNVKRVSNGYSTKHAGFELNVLLGRIERIEACEDDCMIALPANEFFDDECITDTRSALGAYMQQQFRDNIPKITTLVKRLLRDEPREDVEKEPGMLVPSFGVGKCLYLDRPMSSPNRIALVAVTTKRANEGLQAEPRFIFDAISSIQNEMANHRLRRLYLPVLGSGHGGLKGVVSLVCMLIAFTDLHRRPSGHHLRNVNIVVFKRDDDTAPSIPEKSIKRALDFASRLLQD